MNYEIKHMMQKNDNDTTLLTFVDSDYYLKGEGCE